MNSKLTLIVLLLPLRSATNKNKKNEEKQKKWQLKPLAIRKRLYINIWAISCPPNANRCLIPTQEHEKFLDELTSADDAKQVVENRRAKKRKDLLSMGGIIGGEIAECKVTLWGSLSQYQLFFFSIFVSPQQEVDVEMFDGELSARVDNVLWVYQKPQMHMHGPPLPSTPQVSR